MMEFLTQAFEWAKANDNMLGAIGSTLAIVTLFITNGALIMRKLFGKGAESIPQSIPSINYKADAPDYGDIPAIACLPFIDRGLSDKNFADGLLDDVISLVQKDRFIAAASRTSVEQFKSSQNDIRRIARALGVGYVLEGTLREGDGKLRLTVQMLDSKGATKWSDRFDAIDGCGLDAQDKMAADIAQGIHDILIPKTAPESVKVAAEVVKQPTIRKKAKDWHADTGRTIGDIANGIMSASKKTTDYAIDAHNKLDPRTAKTARDIASSIGFTLGSEPEASRKLRSLAIFLCFLGFFPGVGGLHRFYVKRPWTGLLYIFSLGLFYFGTLLDLIVLLSGAFGDGKGRPVTYWTKAERDNAHQTHETI